jgi:hypothetical protein
MLIGKGLRPLAIFKEFIMTRLDENGNPMTYEESLAADKKEAEKQAKKKKKKKVKK